jgi:acido-empty-quinoprotein group A
MNYHPFVVTSALMFSFTVAQAQSPANEDFSKPATTSWPTYHGDYSGRHDSVLRQITPANVKGLTLAWFYRVPTGNQGAILGGAAPAAGADGLRPAAAAPGNGGPGLGAPAPRNPGGGFGGARAATIKSIPLQKDGVLYFTTTNNAYAVDAVSGADRWHYAWQGRTAIGNRGVGMLGNTLFFETGDNHIVALDTTSGKERWNKALAPSDAINFSTSAPLIIRNHVIVGVGGDSGPNSTWVEARDPDTGEVQWQWYVTPRAGEPGVETWPSAAAAAVGAGAPWQPPTYDPQLNLIYVTTGNPTPTYNGHSREGDNLYTCSIVALNPDTGKLVWYYQISPHDTHDWDSTQTPVLIDANYEGAPRKMVAIASRNGYYFLLDRTNGKMLAVKPFIPTANGYKGLGPNKELIPNKELEPSQGGSLVSPDSDGAANYPAPAFSPSTGLFYVNATTSFSIFYLFPDKRDPTGFARGSEHHTGLFDSSLLALDFATGNVKWEHKYPEAAGFWSSTYPGVLSTDSGLLFSGDPSGNFVAFDQKSGKSLWHAALNTTVSNTPETYELQGKQYVVVASGDTLFAFALQ